MREDDTCVNVGSYSQRESARGAVLEDLVEAIRQSPDVLAVAREAGQTRRAAGNVFDEWGLDSNDRVVGKEGWDRCDRFLIWVEAFATLLLERREGHWFPYFVPCLSSGDFR